MGIGAGPRLHEVCPFGSESLLRSYWEWCPKAAIKAGYKQVFNNMNHW